MSKSSTASSRSRTGTFPSPGTPSYPRHSAANAAAYPNGWASERVPLYAGSSNRRCGRSGVLLPFNNGHKLPSKWEDAEKWILSPVSTEAAERLPPPQSLHRRPKSKSGPLGHPVGIPGCSLSASPLSAFGATSSPFSTGVLMADQMNNAGLSNVVIGNVGASRDSILLVGGRESAILRSSSMHISPEMLTETSSSMHVSEDTMVPIRDDEIEIIIQADAVISSPAAKKDASTQMSPNCSAPSSPKVGRLSFSYLSSPHGLVQDVDIQVSKVEVRDVLVDDQVTVTRWSKRHCARGGPDMRSPSSVVRLRSSAAEARVAAFDERERSRCKQEEAKITAWENLQKAKAEAAMRKLEVTLEKKRSSSMDKILNKLRSAQRRAQDMRRAASSDGEQKASRHERRHKPFRGCFGCLAC